MASTTPIPIPAERIARYDRLIATIPGVERKGVTIPYTSLNGHMFSYLTEAGALVLRLAPDDRERFLATFETSLHQAHGIVQKEFVDVPDELFSNLDQTAPWLARAHAYVAARKPKATTRRRG
jgi:hypothetical protein